MFYKLIITTKKPRKMTHSGNHICGYYESPPEKDGYSFEDMDTIGRLEPLLKHFQWLYERAIIADFSGYFGAEVLYRQNLAAYKKRLERFEQYYSWKLNEIEKQYK